MPRKTHSKMKKKVLNRKINSMRPGVESAMTSPIVKTGEKLVFYRLLHPNTHAVQITVKSYRNRAMPCCY